MKYTRENNTTTMTISAAAQFTVQARRYLRRCNKVFQYKQNGKKEETILKQYTEYGGVAKVT